MSAAQAGDTVLLECPPSAKNISDDVKRQLHFFESSDIPNIGKKTLLSALIMIGMILLSSLKVMTLLEAAFLAALVMVLLRCCSVSQAFKSINWNILMVFAGSVALGTAFANDQAADLVFAQQVLGLGREGDVLFAISTSGNSKNVLYAAEIARVRGLKTVALTGRSGGRLKPLADITIAVPEDETYRIQELHLPIYHILCLMLEEHFFGR